MEPHFLTNDKIMFYLLMKTAQTVDDDSPMQVFYFNVTDKPVSCQ